MIKFFGEINNQDIYTCWGKGASLWEMTQAGFPVPEGFVLTTKAFWLSSDKREKQVIEAFDKLDTQFVAVRSSWTKEDGEMDSFAGQFETFLFVTRDKLIEKIVECHNSINSNRIISYCESKNINRKEIKVAVVIQKMVNSDVAGVCFTANPVSWSRDEIMIEAGYWVGEAVVSWMITPDNYLINKITGNIQKNISEQTRKLVLDLKNWWIQEEQVSSQETKLQKLSDKHIQELGEYVKKIEAHYWKPMDIERAVEKEKLYILQARPITTLKNHDLVEEYTNDTMTESISQKTWWKQNKSILKNREEYFETWRWISPVLEYETWLDRSNTEDAIKLGLGDENLGVAMIDGHYFLPKGGLYPKLVKCISEEFESGKFQFTNEILKLAKFLSKECLSLAKKVKDNPQFDDFLRAFNLIARIRFPWMASFSIGDASEKFLNQYAQNKKLTLDQVTWSIPQLINSLTADQKQLIAFKEKIQKLNLPFDIDVIEKENKYLAYQIKKYQKETEYIWTHHFWGVERNIANLLEAIKNAGSDQGKKIKSKIDREPGLNIIAEATKRRLECAQSSAFLAYAYRSYLTNIAEFHGLSYSELIFLTTTEIKNLMNEKVDYLPIIKERQKGLAMFKLEENINILTGSEFFDLKKHFGLLEEIGEIDSFNGTIGNGGCVTGKVAVVLKPDDQDKVHPGMILVSPETTPDFIPSMGKAVGFITDHGGVTSHAAIVAREMGKPCVIGTKIATQVLKDGDFVEVDADNGIVKILEKHDNNEKDLLDKYIQLVKSDKSYIEFSWWISNMAFWDLCYGLYRQNLYEEYWYPESTKKPYLLLTKWLFWTNFNSTREIAKHVYHAYPSIYESKNYIDYLKYAEKANLMYSEFTIADYTTPEKIKWKIKELSLFQWKIWHLPWFASWITDILLLELCDEEKIENRDEFLQVATLPTFLTYALRKDKDLLEWKDISWAICDFSLPLSREERELRMMEEKKRDFKEIKKNIEKAELQIQENKEKINDYLTKNPGHKKLLDFIQVWTFIRDHRKEPMEKVMIVKADLYRKLSEFYSCPIEHVATMADFEIDQLENPDFQHMLKERYEKWSMFIIDQHMQKVVNVDYDELLQEFHSHEEWTDTLKGTVASSWLVEWRCQIIRSKNDVVNFKQGHILVASKIRIEYLSAVKKCIWIITDEWWITAHAWIIAREFWIPCVIWTQNATKALKDGDFIKLDHCCPNKILE